MKFIQFLMKGKVRISVPNITTNTFFIMHLIMLDQEYLNSYDWILKLSVPVWVVPM
jgi:hypothetical protein